MKNPFVLQAIEVARKAGNLLIECFGNLAPEKIFHKGTYDLVTEADKESEKLIVEEISKAYPDHSLTGEEFTDRSGTSSYRWIIDPLDGTTNFAHGHPSFAVSIGLVQSDENIAGVVYAPYFDEMFYAAVGEGAYLNGNPIQVSVVDNIEKSLLATGFPYQRNETSYNNMDNFCKLLKKTQGIRRCGAAALELCYVACGRYDGFWEMWLKSHDVAAGSLIVQEAGGKVTDWEGGKEYLYGKNIIASNGKIHEQIHGELSPFPKEEWSKDIS